MEDDEEVYSYHSPSSNGRITVAAPPPSSTPSENTLTLALPIQQPQHNQNRKAPGSSSGGGREDCWSEDATAVLIDAWGERYLELSRGNLKQKHWKDVADIVSSRADYTKTPKTDIQCKNRIDTVKKKYKAEKAKISSCGGSSKWRFFDKIGHLIGPAGKVNPSYATPQADAYDRVPMGIPVGVRSVSALHQHQFQQKPNLRMSKRPKVDYSEEESEPENSADSSDGLPPVSYKRPRVQREVVNVNNNANLRQGMMNKSDGGGSGSEKYKESNWGNSMRVLTRSILKLGEAYEQAETAKLQQMVELEKQRMKFAKELELQRMQFSMKMQMELMQLKDWTPGEKNDDNCHGIKGNNGVNDNNNNSDSSN